MSLIDKNFLLGGDLPDYTQTLNQAELELHTRLQQQQWLAERIEYLKATILTLRNLSGKQQEPFGSFVGGLIGIDPNAGLTDNCRRILCGTNGPIAPTAIRDQLQASGIDLSRHPNPMAMIHTALSRLCGMGQAEEVRNLNTGKIIAYRWIR